MLLAIKWKMWQVEIFRATYIFIFHKIYVFTYCLRATGRWACGRWACGRWACGRWADFNVMLSFLQV